MSRESLATLKKLVQELEDRDLDLKRDMSLFETAFKSFPIPVTIWSTDKRGFCESCRVIGTDTPGWSFTPAEPANAADLYHCSGIKSQLPVRIERALAGLTQSFICQEDSACIWTLVQPTWSNQEVIGVVGISMDITSSFDTFRTIKNTLSPPLTSEENFHAG
jgi:hypothetical protein